MNLRGAMTLSTTTFRLMTFSIRTLIIMGLLATLSVNVTRTTTFWHYSLSAFMLNVIMSNVAMTSVVGPS